MDTDKELNEGPDWQGPGGHPLKQETHAIMGCAFQVLNGLGHGWNQKCHEYALAAEFRLRKIAFNQLRQFEVLCKG